MYNDIVQKCDKALKMLTEFTEEQKDLRFTYNTQYRADSTKHSVIISTPKRTVAHIQYSRDSRWAISFNAGDTDVFSFQTDTQLIIMDSNGDPVLYKLCDVPDVSTEEAFFQQSMISTASEVESFYKWHFFNKHLNPNYSYFAYNDVIF